MSSDGYPAVLYSPGLESGLSCRALPRGDSIEAREGAEVRAILPYSSMNVSVTGMEDRYLCFEDSAGEGPARLLVPDREIIGHIEALGAPRRVVDQLGQAVKVRTRRKAGRITGLAVVLGVLIAIVLIAWAAFGWAVDRVVDEIPPQWEVEIGRASAAQILAENQVCSDPELEGVVSEMGRRLVVGMGTTPFTWRIRVLDSDDVNAFALPGGYIFINRGLLERSDSPHEVGGVVAHEIQHVLHRHGMKNIVREIGLAIIVYAIVGDGSQAQRFLVGNAAGLASMSFSRDQETEADLFGMDLVYRAGLDPSGLAVFMRKLAADEGLKEITFLSTHPGSLERAKELERLAHSRGRPQGVPIDTDWRRVKGQCAPVSVTDPDQI